MKGTTNVTNPLATHPTTKRSTAKSNVDSKVRRTVSTRTQRVRTGGKPSSRISSHTNHRTQDSRPTRQRTAKKPLQETWDLAKELEDESLKPTDKATLIVVVLFLIVIGLLLGRVV